jgi:type I restriction enzyme R subunit
MSLHKEISFEDEICGHLAAHGWFHDEGDAALYDRSRAVFGPDLIAWVQATQESAWDTLAKNHGTGRRAYCSTASASSSKTEGRSMYCAMALS